MPDTVLGEHAMARPHAEKDEHCPTHSFWIPATAVASAAASASTVPPPEPQKQSALLAVFSMPAVSSHAAAAASVAAPRHDVW